MDHRAPRTSEIIAALPDSFVGDSLTIGELIVALRNRVFGVGILIFAIPNIFPMPPGVPAAMGAVLMLLGGQLALGWNSIWLPKKLQSRSIPRETLKRIADRSVPWIQKFEKISKPRLDAFTTPIAVRWVGAAVFVLGFVLLMPFPFLGNIPPGAAACVFGLGLVERDGLIVVFGYLASLVALGITALATWVLYAGASFLFF
ncbi:exopolysaccharide biosynthesis protein [Flaviflagellibacter deserti]|uniref:Exopolysaccharide biosynthesis protein n=1 Tax=Flaviflagellibacter deserti TaxID=2267266 RepID=A0ABV9Z563_9HYPH